MQMRGWIFITQPYLVSHDFSCWAGFSLGYVARLGFEVDDTTYPLLF